MNGDINKKLNKLLIKTDAIEKQLEKLTSQPIEYHITIHDLAINDPVLKELTFSLDKLDIKELSGALNMGNNFGPKVEQKPKKQQQKEEENKSEPKNSDKKSKQQKDSSEKKDTDIIVKINNVEREFTVDQPKE